MEYSADTVWGCAVAADRINKGFYITNLEVGKKEPNKKIVKRMLLYNDYDAVTLADIEKGKELRSFFKGFVLKQLSGSINEFETQVLKIAQLETFTQHNLLEFAIISSLPACARREDKERDLARAVFHSTPVRGNVGDNIVGDLLVMKSTYSKQYNKYRVTGRFGESFVYFWTKSMMHDNMVYKIQGRIKRKTENEPTELNYVRL